MINSRLPVIIRDAELSVLKIADLQNIEIHKPTNSDNRRSIPVDGALGVAAWSAQSDRTLLTLMVVMATLLTGWSASSSCSSSQSWPLWEKIPCDLIASLCDITPRMSGDWSTSDHLTPTHPSSRTCAVLLRIDYVHCHRKLHLFITVSNRQCQAFPVHKQRLQ